jgi:peptidoglycan/LPS O-acetylase OafA/YrhL
VDGFGLVFVGSCIEPCESHFGKTTRMAWYDIGKYALSVWTPSKTGGKLDCLHGVRALMTLWVTSFHSHWFGGMFLTKPEFYNMLWFNPTTIPLMRGLSAVDVFFLMTGFLLAEPILTKSREIKVKDFWWRRWVRIIPGYVAALLFHCQILFPNGKAYPLSLLKTDGMAELLHRGDPTATDVPSACEWSVFNLLFLNNNLPFGGCMGWTWSLAVQFQFYMLFPLVLRWTGRGSRLVWVAAGSVVLSLALRIAGWYLLKLDAFEEWPLHIFDAKDIDPLFVLFFFWYMPFTIRVATMFSGVAMAYFTVNKGLIDFLKPRKTLHYTLLVASVAVFVASFLTLTRSLFLLSMLYVGGPLFNASLFYMLFSVINASELEDKLAMTFRSFLELKIWYPISVLSYGAYLVHPSIMQKMYSTVFYPVIPSLSYFFGTTFINLILTFMVAFVLYVFVQEPFSAILKPSRFATTTPEQKKVE